MKRFKIKKGQLERIGHEVEIPEGAKSEFLRGRTEVSTSKKALEMGFAHVLNKKLYVLNPLPELSYSSELLAMQPVILNGDLSMIGKQSV